MTQPAKHTPGPSTEDIMMFFDLSDEDWDDLTGRMQDQLRDAYISHTDPVRAAAPAMYEALTHALSVCEAEAELRGENDIDDYLGGAAGPVARMIRAALAQAEARA